MPTTPRVTVILTSYNHARFLPEAIGSILNQTYRDFDLIIWDDGSTDGSWEIIQSYNDLRIRAQRRSGPDQGVIIPTILTTIKLNEYIAIAHSDDVWEPEKLARQVAWLESHPETGAVFTQVSVIDEDGRRFEDPSNYYFDVFEEPNRTRQEWLRFFFYKGNALAHPSILIRQQCYQDCGVQRYGMMHVPDIDTWVRLCLKYEIFILPEKLIRFRIHSDGQNSSADRPDQFIRVQFEYMQILKHYQQIRDPEELIRVFPAAQQYRKPGGMDVDFALAMVTLEAQRGGFADLFALQILFDLLNDPESRVRIRDLYDFGNIEFLALTRAHDVFSIMRMHEYRVQIAERDSHVQELEAHIQTMTGQLDDIYRSKGWKALQSGRRLVGFLRRHGPMPPS